MNKKETATVLALLGEVLKNQVCIMESLRFPQAVNPGIADSLKIRQAKTRKQISNVTKLLRGGK